MENPQDEGSNLLGNGKTISLGGKDWILSPITMGDLFEFEEWARMSTVNQSLDLIQERQQGGRPVPDFLAAELISCAMRDGASMSQQQIAAKYYTLDGVRRLFWMHVRNMPGGPRLDDCRNVVTEENKTSVWTLLAGVSSVVDPFGIAGRQNPVEAMAEASLRSSDGGDDSSRAHSKTESSPTSSDE